MDESTMKELKGLDSKKKSLEEQLEDERRCNRMLVLILEKVCSVNLDDELKSYILKQIEEIKKDSE